ncbi:hypothetical protein BVX98_07130, partial [bacterium F11]
GFSKREELQVAFRTARRGNEGTFAQFDHLEDNNFLNQYVPGELMRELKNISRRGLIPSEVEHLFDRAQARRLDRQVHIHKRRSAAYAHLVKKLFRTVYQMREGELPKDTKVLTRIIHRDFDAIQREDTKGFKKLLKRYGISETSDPQMVGGIAALVSVLGPDVARISGWESRGYLLSFVGINILLHLASSLLLGQGPPLWGAHLLSLASNFSLISLVFVTILTFMAHFFGGVLDQDANRMDESTIKIRLKNAFHATRIAIGTTFFPLLLMLLVPASTPGWIFWSLQIFTFIMGERLHVWRNQHGSITQDDKWRHFVISVLWRSLGIILMFAPYLVGYYFSGWDVSSPYNFIMGTVIHIGFNRISNREGLPLLGPDQEDPIHDAFDNNRVIAVRYSKGEEGGLAFERFNKFTGGFDPIDRETFTEVDLNPVANIFNLVLQYYRFDQDYMRFDGVNVFDPKKRYLVWYPAPPFDADKLTDWVSANEKEPYRGYFDRRFGYDPLLPYSFLCQLGRTGNWGKSANMHPWYVGRGLLSIFYVFFGGVREHGEGRGRLFFRGEAERLRNNVIGAWLKKGVLWSDRVERFEPELRIIEEARRLPFDSVPATELGDMVSTIETVPMTRWEEPQSVATLIREVMILGLLRNATLAADGIVPFKMGFLMGDVGANMATHESSIDGMFIPNEHFLSEVMDTWLNDNSFLSGMNGIFLYELVSHMNQWEEHEILKAGQFSKLVKAQKISPYTNGLLSLENWLANEPAEVVENYLSRPDVAVLVNEDKRLRRQWTHFLSELSRNRVHPSQSLIDWWGLKLVIKPLYRIVSFVFPSFGGEAGRKRYAVMVGPLLEGILFQLLLIHVLGAPVPLAMALFLLSHYLPKWNPITGVDQLQIEVLKPSQRIRMALDEILGEPGRKGLGYKSSSDPFVGFTPRTRLIAGKLLRVGDMVEKNPTLSYGEGLREVGFLKVKKDPLILIEESLMHQVDEVVEGCNTLAHQEEGLLVVVLSRKLARAMKTAGLSSSVQLVDAGDGKAFQNGVVDINQLLTEHPEIETHYRTRKKKSALTIYASSGIRTLLINKKTLIGSVFHHMSHPIDLAFILNILNAIGHLRPSDRLKPARKVLQAA